jgi:NAD kinase
MDRVALVGLQALVVERELKSAGFIMDKVKPQVVVSYGGDGTALFAEALYPGIPRLTLKHSSVCEKCAVTDARGRDLPKIFAKLREGRYKIVEETKVEGMVEGEKGMSLIGLNEINVAHALPTRAMRFDLWTDGKVAEKGVIADGAIVATPYGSSGYFKVITGRKFSKGIGIALNNASSGQKYRFLNDRSEVRIDVIRGPALLCADNNSTTFPLKEGDTVIVRKSKETARLIQISGEERKIAMSG